MIKALAQVRKKDSSSMVTGEKGRVRAGRRVV